MKHIAIVILFLLTLPVFAQKTETVEGEYTYCAPPSMSLAEAKKQALSLAQNKAIADEFGTNISQYNTLAMTETSVSSSHVFSSLGGSEVKGEWIETIGEPEFEISHENESLWVKCKVKGRAREIVTAKLDLEAHVLRNGTQDKFEGHELKARDDLYFSFTAPVSGYLAIYLLDDEQMAWRILPYPDQQDGAYTIEANKRYVFWDPKSAKPEERDFLEDGLTVTCSGEEEANVIYFIFSPHKFTRAGDKRGLKDASQLILPPQLPFDKFNKWLVDNRKKDVDMNVVIQPVTITVK